jgi:hypothetical protein
MRMNGFWRIKSAWMSVIGAAFPFVLHTPAYAQDVKADHTTLNVESLSQEALDKARAFRMSLDHASVGENILGGMRALEATNKARYAFPNWLWHDRGNPGAKAKVDQFVQWVGENSAKYDAFMSKFCFIDQDADFAYYRDNMLALEAKYPTKKFVWWTMPIWTENDSRRTAFNTAIRKYCAANNKPLYDIAAIESHTTAGAPVSSKGEAMDQSYTNDGGHLNEVGALRAAKAMWWLMVKLSGSSQTAATSIPVAQDKTVPSTSGSTSPAKTAAKPVTSEKSSNSCNITLGRAHGDAALWVMAFGFTVALRRRRRL